jgi:hypothetical protein
MKILPTLIVTQFAQLEPGDLFVFPYGEGACVALKVRESDEDMLMVPLGPVFPDGLTHPSLVSAPSATVISFGKEYTLRLPSHAGGWRASPPYTPARSPGVCHRMGDPHRRNGTPADFGIPSVIAEVQRQYEQ